jgi:hypothetical protein
VAESKEEVQLNIGTCTAKGQARVDSGLLECNNLGTMPEEGVDHNTLQLSIK